MKQQCDMKEKGGRKEKGPVEEHPSEVVVEEEEEASGAWIGGRVRLLLRSRRDSAEEEEGRFAHLAWVHQRLASYQIALLFSSRKVIVVVELRHHNDGLMD